MSANKNIQIGRLATDFVALIDHVSMVFLVDQLAANVLNSVKTMPIDGYPTEGVGGELAARFNWAAHGYTNSLQDEVSFVYAFVKFLVESQIRFPLPEQAELHLYADALSAYQKWKTRLVMAEKEVHGPHWGDATDFYTADWTDLNDSLLELRKPV